jgi:hypothetical protein
MEGDAMRTHTHLTNPQSLGEDTTLLKPYRFLSMGEILPATSIHKQLLLARTQIQRASASSADAARFAGDWRV